MTKDTGVVGVSDKMTSNAGATWEASSLVTLGLLIVSSCLVRGLINVKVFLLKFTHSDFLYIESRNDLIVSMHYLCLFFLHYVSWHI
ncbi:hypothetical protein EDC96DRAFT_523181 [Choanephora cucurbitarum]|nr:hypothetical protein EDC96DRAFT_523181 [Choanephora cucurbitarum]